LKEHPNGYLGVSLDDIAKWAHGNYDMNPEQGDLRAVKGGIHRIAQHPISLGLMRKEVVNHGKHIMFCVVEESAEKKHKNPWKGPNNMVNSTGRRRGRPPKRIGLVDPGMSPVNSRVSTFDYCKAMIWGILSRMTASVEVSQLLQDSKLLIILRKPSLASQELDHVLMGCLAILENDGKIRVYNQDIWLRFWGEGTTNVFSQYLPADVAH
jgi:hypothetical protein